MDDFTIGKKQCFWVKAIQNLVADHNVVQIFIELKQHKIMEL